VVDTEVIGLATLVGAGPGGAWAAMLCLGLAYGLLEAGVTDQTLFNPPGAADAPAAYLPALGLSASNALGLVVGHAVFSIGVPIAIVEAWPAGNGPPRGWAPSACR
jgi:hypothetical protein